MKYQIWLAQLGSLIKSSFDNANGWENWDDWQSYFNEGVTPKQALIESHRTV